MRKNPLTLFLVFHPDGGNFRCACVDVTHVQLVATTIRGLCGLLCQPVGSQGVGSHVHLCPRPCLSTCRWARIPTHQHKRTTRCAARAPILAVLQPHVCHRQTSGLSPLARTCSWTESFLRQLHDSAHRFIFQCITNLHSKIGDSFCKTLLFSVRAPLRV